MFSISIDLSDFYIIASLILAVCVANMLARRILNFISSEPLGSGRNNFASENHGSGRHGHEEMDVHSRYIDRYGLDAYNKRFGGE